MHSEVTAEARGAAQYAADDVTAPLIRGDAAVRDRECEHANMIGDNPYRDIGLQLGFGCLAGLIPFAGDLRNALDDGRKEIGVVIRCLPLENRTNALESHTRIDVPGREG